MLSLRLKATTTTTKRKPQCFLLLVLTRGNYSNRRNFAPEITLVFKCRRQCLHCTKFQIIAHRFFTWTEMSPVDNRTVRKFLRLLWWIELFRLHSEICQKCYFLYFRWNRSWFPKWLDSRLTLRAACRPEMKHWTHRHQPTPGNGKCVCTNKADKHSLAQADRHAFPLRAPEKKG